MDVSFGTKDLRRGRSPALHFGPLIPSQKQRLALFSASEPPWSLLLPEAQLKTWTSSPRRENIFPSGKSNRWKQREMGIKSGRAAFLGCVVWCGVVWEQCPLQKWGDSYFQNLCFGVQGGERFHLLPGVGTNSSDSVGDIR